MVYQFNQGHPPPQPFSVDDIVAVTVPPEDRQGSMQAVIGVIHEAVGTGYRVKTPLGIISRCFPPHSLTLLDISQRPDQLDTPEANSSVTLRSVARKTGLSIGVISARCGCRGACANNKCAYHRAGTECTGSCHRGTPCSNQPQQGKSSTATTAAAGGATRGATRGGRGRRSRRGGRGGRGGGPSTAEAPATAEGPATAEVSTTIEGRGGRRGRGRRVRRGSRVARDGGITRSGRVSRLTALARGDD
ncbi:uncharacterized protein K452DRAFT_129074 [Aplosporella prunicola CBS 121167]|uniref:Uncharacterized protein n=1 Tax=Aplosporella prunicola CBS 121167 TaxID=1176127 RepID=A0A6A6AX27_9PEZI|nr:uncharacterized protein K452DRAFT_129074 [Aplosporella prunicola CBS 121167]KAF2136542.1 hypothetical protein K452DRAFT_129074 [Aplosporella prunicola CBS 121167]